MVCDTNESWLRPSPMRPEVPPNGAPWLLVPQPKTKPSTTSPARLSSSRARTPRE
uniref:Uncharacterized protein n=1 Tax=Arundo donax TaxID=35708 RepID=A0A0A9FA72_ARUDO